MKTEYQKNFLELLFLSKWEFKAKGKEGYMARKINLEKAYDKLEWRFIRERLFHINLPMDLIDLIISCISSVTTIILFNGGTMDPITPS